MQNEINLILPTLNEPNRKKSFLSAVLGTVASQIIGLVFEGISSFLHHKMYRALNKAIKQINERQNIEHNRIYHLEDTMIMYGKYNSDTLTNLIDTVHRMHNLTISMLHVTIVVISWSKKCPCWNFCMPLSLV